MILEGHVEIGDPLIGEDVQTKVGDPLTKENTLIEILLEENILIEMRDPLEEGGYPGGGPPDDDGGPPGDGGPSGNGGLPEHPGGQGPPGPQVPPGPIRPLIVQTPQVMLDMFALKNTFDSVGQSMLQLARTQDQTNRQLQQHIQQGQVNMQAHTGALQQLATSTYQRNFNHIFTSIPIYDGSG